MKNKQIILLVIIIISVAILLVINFYNKKAGSTVSFSELNMIEGVIEGNEKNILKISVTKTVLDDARMDEKIVNEFMTFIPDDKIKISSEMVENKNEEDFRKEEMIYADWIRKPESERDIYSFIFPPSWNKEKVISLADLKAGDSIKIIYYKNNENDELAAIKIFKKLKNINQNETINNEGRVIGFMAEVKELGDNIFSVKPEKAVTGVFLKDEDLEIVVNSDSLIYKKIFKSEEDFKNEEESLAKEIQRIKNENGEILTLKAPSRFEEKIINLGDIKIGDKVELFVLISDGKYLAQKIQQIIK